MKTTPNKLEVVGEILDDWATLSLCKSCNCMTKTFTGKCGKCGAMKTKTKSELEKNFWQRFDIMEEYRFWAKAGGFKIETTDPNLNEVLDWINANYVPRSEIGKAIDESIEAGKQLESQHKNHTINYENLKLLVDDEKRVIGELKAKYLNIKNK